MTSEELLLIVEKNGGGTFKVDGEGNINNTTHQSGFYVAIRDTEELYDNLDTQIVKSFIERNKKMLESAYLGVWLEPKTKKYYIEVSQYYTDRTTARAMMRINNQLCVFDIANKASIYYVDMFKDK